MVGVVYLSADLWTLRTTTPKLDTTACRLINKLGIQRRPTKRGCRVGRLVRQRYRPDDNINTTVIETETDLPFTTTPIKVIYPSRRRITRSDARRCSSSSSVNINTSWSVCVRRCRQQSCLLSSRFISVFISSRWSFFTSFVLS